MKYSIGKLDALPKEGIIYGIVQIDNKYIPFRVLFKGNDPKVYFSAMTPEMTPIERKELKSYLVKESKKKMEE